MVVLAEVTGTPEPLATALPRPGADNGKAGAGRVGPRRAGGVAAPHTIAPVHRSPFLFVVALVAAGLGLAAVPARAQGLDDDKAKLEQVRSQRATAASKIDTLKADEGEMNRALDALDDDVRGQEALYDGAKRKAAAAQAEAQVARAEVAAKQRELDDLARAARQSALQAYVQPSDDFTETLGVEHPTDAIVKRALAELTSRRSTDVIDEYDAARDDLAYRQALADRAAKKAADRQEAADARLEKLQSSLQRQQVAVADIEDQLDNALSEAAGLANLDRRLSVQLAAKQAELASRLAKARSLSDRAGGGSDLDIGGGRDVGSIVVVNVGGIEVNARIAGQVAALVAAARNDGINLGGDGYRSSSGQVAVRRANCGGGRYAIYSMPPSRCRPPAARPGKSMHEQGLAIDFTCDGVLITSRSHRCFRWLSGYAAAYGLQNYWREPWHWSTNGR